METSTCLHASGALLYGNSETRVLRAHRVRGRAGPGVKEISSSVKNRTQVVQIVVCADGAALRKGNDVEYMLLCAQPSASLWSDSPTSIHVDPRVINPGFVFVCCY
jgi:hypothetical protein